MKFLTGLATLLLAGALIFIWKFFSIPPKINTEKTAQIDALQALKERCVVANAILKRLPEVNDGKFKHELLLVNNTTDDFIIVELSIVRLFWTSKSDDGLRHTLTNIAAAIRHVGTFESEIIKTEDALIGMGTIGVYYSTRSSDAIRMFSGQSSLMFNAGEIASLVIEYDDFPSSNARRGNGELNCAVSCLVFTIADKNGHRFTRTLPILAIAHYFDEEGHRSKTALHPTTTGPVELIPGPLREGFCKPLYWV